MLQYIVLAADLTIGVFIITGIEAYWAGRRSARPARSHEGALAITQPGDPAEG